MRDIPSPHPSDQGKGGTFIRQPDGTLRDVFELMKEHRERGESQMSVALLKEGDVVAFQYPESEKKEKQFLFEISGVVWDNIGVSYGFCPQPRVNGKIQDVAFVKDAPSSVESVFVGSGFGGKIRTPALIATGRTTVFSVAGFGEVQSPPISYFGVFRKNEKSGQYKALEPNQLDTEAGKANATHRKRREYAQTLMKIFGFDSDFLDCSQDTETYTPLFRYDGERYSAEYQPQMALGNALGIFDHETKEWLYVKYFNRNNEDVLQIAFADLRGTDVERIVAGGLTHESSIHASGAAMTTGITSERFGIQGVNYKPSEEEARTHLNIPPFQDGSIPRPNIQLWPDGKIVVSREYPLSIMEEQHPDLFENIQKAISFSQDAQGNITLQLGGKTIQLKNPDTALKELVRHLQ